MRKSEFIRRLSRELSGLSADEIIRSTAFYEEIIADRMEEGMTEEESVGSLGEVEDIAKEIMSDLSFLTITKAKVKKGFDNIDDKKVVKALTIITCPLWGTLLVAVLALIVATYVVLWTTIAVISLLCIVLEVGGVVLMAIGVGSFFILTFPTGLLILGTGMLMLGIGLVLFRPCGLVVKSIVALTRVVITKSKLALARVGGKQ